jgi:isoleucyl-tRNA synthetase
MDLLHQPELSEPWEALLKVRNEVNAALEEKRKDKVIGNSLTARVVLTATGPVGALLESRRAQLPTLFIVSDLELRTSDPGGADSVRVDVERAPGVKCERCWRYVPSVREDPDWAGLCDRCVGALAEPAHQ